MKIREDYEYSGWRLFVHWVNGDPKEDYLPAENLRPDQILSKDESAN